MNDNNKAEKMVKHTITKKDVDNNPDEGLKEGEEIEIPLSEIEADSSDDEQETNPEDGESETSGIANGILDEKDAAGQSKLKTDIERDSHKAN